MNFAALGAAFDVSSNMISAATVADNLLMVLYFFVLITIPSIGFFRRHYKHPYMDKVEAASSSLGTHETNASAFWVRKEIFLRDIALCAASGFVIVALSNIISTSLRSIIPVNNPLPVLFCNRSSCLCTADYYKFTADAGFCCDYCLR